ncbi:MAG: hypothetical protein IJR82_00710 [Bacilli bacterium]|nr:hypothetical protein [Bacilli bacterium]
MQPLARDLKNDDKRIFEETNDGYCMSVKVRYDNDANLVKQKICLDKDLNLVKIEVMDKQENVKMRFTVLEYDLKKTYDDDYFKLSDEFNDNEENNIKQNADEEKNETDENNQQTSKIEDIVYPMYVPVNTYLSNQDKVSLDNGERVIMTFAGETPFLLVQETAKINNTTDFINGDPYLIADTIGAVNDYSVSWINNGVEYNVLSDAMSTDQLIAVAESISSVSIGK